MGLRDIGATLPPGFRFYPSDEEVVCHYLYKKIVNEEALKGSLVEIDLHTCEPWQLPDVAKLNANEWYFFSFRDRKYATGFRTNRATVTGYWKATGKDRTVHDPISREIVGMRKTLVFYRNRAPNGIKTGWIMHEFRLETPHMPPKEDWVLCRVFQRSKASSDNTIDNHHFMLDTTPLSPPSLLIPHGYTTNNNNINHDNYDPMITSSSATSAGLRQNNPSNLFPILHQQQNHVDRSSNDVIIGSNKVVDDAYGFFWGNSDVGGMRFDVDDDGDGLIFQ